MISEITQLVRALRLMTAEELEAVDMVTFCLVRGANLTVKQVRWAVLDELDERGNEENDDNV